MIEVLNIGRYDDIIIAVRERARAMESFQQLTSTVQYAYLQPLKVLDEVAVDSSEGLREFDANGCIEGPALMPIKEEFVSRDLRSYKLFDEPDSLPIIWLELQPRPDDFAVNKMKQPKPTAAKKNLERKVPCQSCDRKFVTVGHMKIHARIHRATSPRRRNKSCCSVCGRKFSHKGALCLHMRSHKLARTRK